MYKKILIILIIFINDIDKKINLFFHCFFNCVKSCYTIQKIALNVKKILIIQKIFLNEIDNNFI